MDVEERTAQLAPQIVARDMGNDRLQLAQSEARIVALQEKVRELEGELKKFKPKEERASVKDTEEPCATK